MRCTSADCIVLLLFSPASEDYLGLPTDLMEISQNEFHLMPKDWVQLLKQILLCFLVLRLIVLLPMRMGRFCHCCLPKEAPRNISPDTAAESPPSSSVYQNFPNEARITAEGNRLRQR